MAQIDDKFRDPKQAKFIEYYFDPKSPTCSNALQSALKAGYKREYAETITSKSKSPKWLSRCIGKYQDMVSKAERNLDEFLEMSVLSKVRDREGSVLDEEEDSGKMKIKADVSKFVAERLKKDKWSVKQEVEHSLGEGLKGLEDKIRKLAEEK